MGPSLIKPSLCSTLWAFAKLETYHKELFDLGKSTFVHAAHQSPPDLAWVENG